jgi:hypothetical protein
VSPRRIARWPPFAHIVPILCPGRWCAPAHAGLVASYKKTSMAFSHPKRHLLHATLVSFSGQKPSCPFPSSCHSAAESWERGPSFCVPVHCAPPRLVKLTSACRAFQPTNSITATFLNSQSGHSFIDCSPKNALSRQRSTHCAGGTSTCCTPGHGNCSNHAISPWAPRTPKTRPATLPRSVRTDLRSPFQSPAPALLAHHLAFPITSPASLKTSDIHKCLHISIFMVY